MTSLIDKSTGWMHEVQDLEPSQLVADCGHSFHIADAVAPENGMQTRVCTVCFVSSTGDPES